MTPTPDALRALVAELRAEAVVMDGEHEPDIAGTLLKVADRLESLIGAGGGDGWTLTFADERDFLLAASPILGAAFADSRAAAERINRCPGGHTRYGEIRASLPTPPGASDDR
jgi:hypothetical protein